MLREKKTFEKKPIVVVNFTTTRWQLKMSKTFCGKRRKESGFPRNQSRCERKEGIEQSLNQ